MRRPSDLLRGDEAGATGRRSFLAQLAAIAGAGLGAGQLDAGGAGGETAGPGAALLPTIPLGPHRITRLVAGWNPIGGYSYQGPHMNRHMREYYTPEKTVEFLLACEREGLNAHQYSLSEKTDETLRRLREAGSRMQLICLHAGRDGVKDVVEKGRPIAVAHHGGVTDSLFAQGKSGEVRDFLKEVHDRGVLAGVSAHNPDCIRRIADEGWEVDFFMGCFYYLTRPEDHAGEGKGSSILPIGGYNFRASDPEAMTAVLRGVPKPCLGFKILGAGRKCGSQDSVREAFRWAFARLKPTDGVIVGMYPRFFDEVGADARYARELGK